MTGVRQDDLVALNADLIPKLLDKVRPEASRLLEMHRQAGRNTYIVSASPVEIVEPLAAALGMTGGIGTVVGRRRTASTRASWPGRSATGPARSTAIARGRRLGGLRPGAVYAYSDSASDLPMLEAVGHPVAVNPDGTLARMAARPRLADRASSAAGPTGRAPDDRRSRRAPPAWPAPPSPAGMASERRRRDGEGRAIGADASANRARGPSGGTDSLAAVARFYVTTPIYYVNDAPHIGHAYTTVIADALARWHRLLGDDVFFLTGTDEHGLKVQRAAEANGVSPRRSGPTAPSRASSDAWELLDITNDDFIRTTEPRHYARRRSSCCRRCYDAGDIELGTYEGLLLRGRRGLLHRRPSWSTATARSTGRPVERARGGELLLPPLAASSSRLLDWYDAHPDVVQPEHRAQRGARASSGRACTTSRSAAPRSTWGIPLPWDPRHVTYVWFDALTNYITAVGYGTDDRALRRVVAGDHHLIGKDILRFHCVYWPAMLLSAGLEPPRRLCTSTAGCSSAARR